MAKFSSVALGKAQGSAGNMTFSVWKGIPVAKQKAVSVANPDTDAQKVNRSAMAQAIAIGRLIYSVIFYGFKSLAIKKSAFNAFTGEARKLAFNYSTPPTAVLTPTDLLISKGTMAPTAIVTVDADRSVNSVIISYSNAITGPGQSLADTALLVAYNETLNEWATGNPGAVRSDGSGSIVMPPSWVTGNTVHGYLGFYSNVDGAASDSVNDNTLIVA